MKRCAGVMGLLFLLFKLCGCGASRSEGTPLPPLFVDQRAASGVDFLKRHDKLGLNILETLGLGAALCDFDDDGNLDLVLLGENRVALYRGDGRFHFQDVTENSGLQQRGHWHGAATGDFDGDGRIDLYTSGYGCSALYRNLGAMRFQDVTAEAGVGVRPASDKQSPEWRTSAAFVDVDHDGRLDLYVLRYVTFGPHTPQLCTRGEVMIACDPQTYDPQRGTLYHNVDGKKFADETALRGMAEASGNALGVACADYDNDGWTDIAVANDERPGDLFRNRGNGHFEQKGPESGTAFDAYGFVHAGMGIDWGDYDRDGRIDLFITTYENEVKNLYRNLGIGIFADMSLRTGISKPLHPWISWGIRFLDYDNDGWLDLMVTSGHVQDQAKKVKPQTDYPQPLVLFHNEKGQTFKDVSAQAGPSFQKPMVGRALCTGDIDNDGGVDVVVANAEGQPLLLRNVTPKRGHWLAVRLQATGSNRHGMGSRITLETNQGKSIRDVHTSGSVFCANDARAHFGLGREEKVQGIVVRWHDGMTERFTPSSVDQTLLLRYGSGKPLTPPRKPAL